MNCKFPWSNRVASNDVGVAGRDAEVAEHGVGDRCRAVQVDSGHVAPEDVFLMTASHSTHSN